MVSQTNNELSPQMRDLPYMTEQEFEVFLRNNADMNLGTREIEYLRTRRRRKSVEMEPEEKNMYKRKYAASVSDEKNDTKIVFLGNETSCEENLNSLYLKGNPTPQSFAPLCVFKQFSEFYNEGLETTDQCRVEIWYPSCLPREERHQAFAGADVIVVMFSVDDRGSFEEATNKWVPEALETISNQYSMPILLVGTKAELRKTVDDKKQELVSSEEAVKFSQDRGVTKYMEIFHQNIPHLKVLLKQAVEASITADNRVADFEKEAKKQLKKEYFVSGRSTLVANSPEAAFDLFTKTFCIEPQEDVLYLYTLDGSDPDRSSAVYESPLEIGDPAPNVIKVFGLSPGKIPSPISAFSVPSSSEDPVGHFNPLTKAFHLKTKPNTVYYYTLDGKKPTEESQVYTSPGILFDNNEPGEAFNSSWIHNIPHSIRMIAQEEGKFSSKTVEFKSFETLDPPKVRIYEKDKILTINTIPGVECRYTLDGSTPRYDSPIYSQPLMLPSDVDFSKIRVAAFPKMHFPSKTVVVSSEELSISPSRKISKPWLKPPPSVKMTKATLATKTSPPPPVQYGKVLDEFHKLVLSPGAKSPPRRSPPLPSKTQSLFKSSLDDNDKGSLTKRSINFERKKLLLDVSTKKEFQVNTETTTEQSTNWKVKCHADSEEVEFTFPEPVIVSNLEVCLPNKGEGPTGYECYAVDEENADIIPLGAGDFANEQGSQKLSIVGAKKTPLAKLVCSFKRGEAQTSFKLVDIKVDGELYHVHNSEGNASEHSSVTD